MGKHGYDQWRPRDLQDGYDHVAEDYAYQFWDELAKKPFDRMVLDRLAKPVHATW